MKTKFKTNYNSYKSTTSINFNNVKPIVQTQFQDESDINNILAKYSRTGVLPNKDRQAHYLDLSQSIDFAQMQDKILYMNEMFMELPARVRADLRTPEEFYQSFQSEDGLKRLEYLGVISKKELATKSAVAESEAQSQVSTGAPEKGVST